MVDQPEQEAKGTGQETIFNSGIGDDWGEAFEAEDFMATPSEETNTAFFLPDEATEATILSIPVEEADKTKPVADYSPGRLAGLLNAIFARLRTIPLPFRLAAVVIPGLALILFLVLRGKAPEQIASSPATQQKTVAAPQPEAEEPAVHPLEPELEAKPEAETSLPNPPEQPAVPEPHQSATEENALKSTPVEPKELRKRWRFPAIIVHAKTDKDHAPVILSTDLTLILKLAPEVMPPSDKESFIREILYQFYTNQPVDDLQRYALERGEMNRKLQAWIMKQWPELHLDSIAIDRYQLL